VSLAEEPIPASLAVRVLGAVNEGQSGEVAWAKGAKAGAARSLLEHQKEPEPGYAVHALVRRVLAYDPLTLSTKQNLAVTLHAQGDLPGARKLYEAALDARTRLLGAEHPATLATMQNLALLAQDERSRANEGPE